MCHGTLTSWALTSRILTLGAAMSLSAAEDIGLERSVLAIPPLLAVGAIHHYLIQQGLRTQASIAPWQLSVRPTASGLDASGGEYRTVLEHTPLCMLDRLRRLCDMSVPGAGAHSEVACH